ncbi:protein of unknown function [Candidatus Nitrosacidococcus tergens]|uniref:Uncharacterized protein n=1 Tax=Candidatus Nitrosacidococcus tergens TaxID=553981 RepID=A0A7G1QA45_9GAMM|nr:protein of unknown function [Candidatus Nitrosacidococcus tergens]
MKQVIETEADTQIQLFTDNQNTIKVSVWVIGGITLIMSVLAVIKPWVM